MDGSKVRLVTYSPEHVAKYHDWMASKEMQELTASEPLTLEQEYEMQLTWVKDPNKCTFIVLDRDIIAAGGTEIEAMVGDVNLYFHPELCGGGEIEIMIAEPSARRKGLALEAVQMMLGHARTSRGTRHFVAKIGAANAPSLRLFREKLHFRPLSFSDAFNEHTLGLWVDELGEPVEPPATSRTESEAASAADPDASALSATLASAQIAESIPPLVQKILDQFRAAGAAASSDAQVAGDCESSALRALAALHDAQGANLDKLLATKRASGAPDRVLKTLQNKQAALLAEQAAERECLLAALRKTPQE